MARHILVKSRLTLNYWLPMAPPLISIVVFYSLFLFMVLARVNDKKLYSLGILLSFSVLSIILVAVAVGHYNILKRRLSGKRLFQDFASQERQKRLQIKLYHEYSNNYGARSIKAPTATLNDHLPTAESTKDAIANGSEMNEADTYRETCQSQIRFDYDLLETSNLRLLQIERSEDTRHPICATMIQMPLLSAMQKGYTALSYTWGRGDSTRNISINGASMKIRPNLEKILRSIRNTSCGLLWADAICINQMDIEERNAQVLRMRGIYAGARNVVVAVDMPDSELVELSRLFTRIQLSAPNQVSWVQDRIRRPRLLSVLNTYCQASYWQRVWILQEFSVAVKIDLLLGDELIDARKLEIALDTLRNGEQELGCEYNRAQVVLDIRRSWQRRMPNSFLNLLRDTSYALCERPHDRVFGILGLVSDTLDFLSEPNYGTDIADLCVSMTSSYIRRRSIDIVVLAQHMCPSNGQHVPSWCPGYFWFRQYPPDEREFSQALRHHESTLGVPPLRSDRGISSTDSWPSSYVHSPSIEAKRNWRATGESPSSCRFVGTAMVSTAYRVGTIKSIGSAFTDQHGTCYPHYDIEWAQRKDITSTDHVARWMVDAMLDTDYGYKEFKKETCLTPPLELLQRHFYVEAFLSSHDNGNVEEGHCSLPQWIRANRRFFVGGRTLAEHAERSPTLSFTFGFRGFQNFDIHGSFRRMIEKGMRMMCLDDAKFGIGWAAKGAQLQDEVFLLPGCSVPLILRRVAGSRQYRLVGDAIVIGAMENEVWSKTRSADLVHVEII